jgi:hypothetical protein
MHYAVDMYVGEKRLMTVSFHKSRLEADMKITDYITEDRENKKDCYSYKVALHFRK